MARASLTHGTVKHQAKHFFYAAGWKKFEALWNFVIRTRQLHCMTPVLESVLSKVTSRDRAFHDPPLVKNTKTHGLPRVRRTILTRPRIARSDMEPNGSSVVR